MADLPAWLQPPDVARLAYRTEMVPIERCDREEFARALVLQGYSPTRAEKMMHELPDNDGALQMLARHRIAAMSGRLGVSG